MILRGIGRRVKQVGSATAAPVRSTDARPAADPSRRRADAAEAAQARRLHRRVVTGVLCAVFLAGTVTALFGKGGYFELRRLRQERIELQAEVEEHRARILALRNQVEALGTDPLARERIAREQLGLARPGEITYILTDPAQTDSGAESGGESADPS